MYQSIYRCASFVISPLLRGLAYRRIKNGKEIKHRVNERFGITGIPRSNKDIIWIHAASNGEALSALPVIDYFQTLTNPPHILMTTMTVTSADLIKKRTSPGQVTHQFIPYDHTQWVQKFHDYWKPNMVIWVESELWPNHLNEIKKRNIPSVLVNARLSDKSVKNWLKVNDWFKSMMACFDVVLAQTDRDAKNLQSLGLNNVVVEGNLKDLSPALPFDTHAANDIRDVIEQRSTLLFASTHDPEEKIAFDIHQNLKKKHPDLLSIIIPRHPKRGEGIADEYNESGLEIARRSLKMSPRLNTDIYIADTLGELGLFYHLCPLVFVGNSMNTKPGGGHNLLEAAWHNCAIVSGGDLHNFSIQASEMPEAEACVIVNNAKDLEQQLSELLLNTNKQALLADNAYAYANKKYDNGMANIINAIQPTCKKAGLV